MVSCLGIMMWSVTKELGTGHHLQVCVCVCVCGGGGVIVMVFTSRTFGGGAYFFTCLGVGCV